MGLDVPMARMAIQGLESAVESIVAIFQFLLRILDEDGKAIASSALYQVIVGGISGTAKYGGSLRDCRTLTSSHPAEARIISTLGADSVRTIHCYMPRAGARDQAILVCISSQCSL